MDHLSQLRAIFEKFQMYLLFLNLEKWVFMVRQSKILGHIVSKNGICTDEEKIKVIVNMPRPNNAREVQAFMGHCGYYRRFIFQYASIAQPLHTLILWLMIGPMSVSSHFRNLRIQSLKLLFLEHWIGIRFSMCI